MAGRAEASAAMEACTVLLLAACLAGCSGAGGALPFTGSTAPAAAAAPAIESTPKVRMEQVAWTAALAEACGFYLDQAKLKQRYLGYETAGGLPAADLQQLDQSYDKARNLVLTGAAKNAAVCTERRLAHLRLDIARYGRDDFSPRANQM